MRILFLYNFISLQIVLLVHGVLTANSYVSVENILKDVMRLQESVSVCQDTSDKHVKKVVAFQSLAKSFLRNYVLWPLFANFIFNLLSHMSRMSRGIIWQTMFVSMSL